MKVIFKTNLDNYQLNCFPQNLNFVPRIGEKLLVKEDFESHFRSKKLPTRLEVVDVSYKINSRLVFDEIQEETVAICELWYCKIDVEVALLNNVNLF